MQPQRRIRFFALLGTLFGLSLLCSCAQLPPSRTTLSGKRLRVVLRFAAPVDRFSHYYVLINLPRDANGNITTGDINAPGPVPVLFPPYGNGFATGPAGERFPFTDFIVFDSLQTQGYALYHVVGEADRGNVSLPTAPITFVTPDPNDPRTARELQFEIDLAQLIVDANGVPLADQAEAANRARAIRFLQINVVATDVVPRDVTTPVAKRVDSLGETARPGGSVNPGLGASSFLTVDVTQIGRVYNNASFIGQLVEEPSAPDVFGGSYPPIDLVDWSIEVREAR
jgi:hypothetical protein